MTSDAFRPLSQASFADLKLRARGDLQRLLCGVIEAGVLLRQPRIAARLHGYFDGLVGTGHVSMDHLTDMETSD